MTGDLPKTGHRKEMRTMMILVQKVDFRLFHASCILQLACIRRQMPPDGTESRDLVR